MTPAALWKRYATAWSLPASTRGDELVACVVDDVAYCDPHAVVEGRDALSEYMAGFQASVPGGHFLIKSVLVQRDRTLAHWDLRGPDDRLLHAGASFALMADDGRLRSISGFFEPAT